MQVSLAMMAIPVFKQACLCKSRDSFGTPKGPTAGLFGVVHIDANEFMAGARCAPVVVNAVNPNPRTISADSALLGRCSVQFCTVLKVSIMKKLFAPVLAAASAVLAAAPAFAQTADPVSALAAVTSLQGSAAGYAPVMFGLAIAVVGIMIGVKWIKRAKGAA